jgi:hypothetical protein
MVLLISYDLNGHERPSAYAAVKKVIEENADDSIRPLYSQWFVETDQTVAHWQQLLTDDVIDENDRLFITQVRAPYDGWLRQEHWDWIRERL